jgi:hypothetical protein
VTCTRHVIQRTVTESFEYDPAEVNALWLTHRGGIPKYLLGGDEDTNDAARVITMFTAFNGALVSPFGSREDFDVGYELHAEDEDGAPA